MKDRYDLIVVGAGPGGLGAAGTAAGHGLSVLVLDDQPGPGGQIFRSIERLTPATVDFLGGEYPQGRALVATFRDSGADYLPGASVWQLDAGRVVSFSAGGVSRQIRGGSVLISTGAMERPVPIPGWTLPGVMGAAAADIMFKSSGMVPSGKIAMAGSGPLFYLVVSRLIALGVPIEVILDTACRTHLIEAVAHLPKALPAIDYLVKGVSMLWRIRRSKIPVYRQVTGITATGRGHVASVVFESGGCQNEIRIDGLFVHEGVIPDVHLTRQAECDHHWDPVQRCWRPKTDRWGRSSIQGVYVVGDAAGIGGAAAAQTAGCLAALEIAHRLGVVSRGKRDRAAKPLLRKLWRLRSIRPFLDGLYRPAAGARVPGAADTIVCRCEEVTAGQIRDAVDRGALGPGQVKAYTRCGMGPCQGRMCGPAVSEIIADRLQVPVADVGGFRVRPPVRPITLGELAEMKLAGPEASLPQKGAKP